MDSLALPRRATPPRASYAMLAALYDVLPVARRLALFSPGGVALTWTLQGERLESGLFLVDGPAHRALARGPERERLVLIPEGEPRCTHCGCVAAFACVGGCAWVAPKRCSRCARLAAPEPRTAIVPGAPLPRPRRGDRGGRHAS